MFERAYTSAFTFKTLLIHYDYAKLMDQLLLKAILSIWCRWDGGDCVHSPGSNKDPVQDSLAVSDEEGAEEEEDDRSSNDDISRVLNKLFGSLGFLIVVLLIIGVCIVLHNHK